MTQIVLRRAPGADAAVKVSIIPGASSSANDILRARLLNFGHTMQAKDFGNLEFTELLDEVCCLYYSGILMEVMTYRFI